MNNKSICGFEFLRFQVFNRDSDGRPNIIYKVKTPTGVIFQGRDFSPPANCFRDPTGKESRCGLLNFLTLKPGDTDSEYFDSYTPEQLEWANSSENEDASMDLMELSEELGID